jgi:MoxR-like ATPase
VATQQTTADARSVSPTVHGFAEIFEAIVANVSQVLQGKEDAIRLALVCIASEGHLLLEDVPGVGKTSLARPSPARSTCNGSGSSSRQICSLRT